MMKNICTTYVCCYELENEHQDWGDTAALRKKLLEAGSGFNSDSLILDELFQ